ncbi:MAG: pyrroline-5-carboxylate reductase [Erysipelotrichaceae bacterium]
MYKIGFVGCGNMGQAMLKSLLKQEEIQPNEIIASAKSEATRAALHNLGVEVADHNAAIAQAQLIVLAVKKEQYPHVAQELMPNLRKDAILISITTGYSLARLQALFEPTTKVVLTMPNTPALVQKGVSAVVYGQHCTVDDMQLVEAFFEHFGSVVSIGEDQLPAFVALAGSSPAYFMMVLEAMADAAVHLGLPRKMAYEIAAKTMEGSATWFLESKKHPGELKDQVCSPKGTTIEAVRVLEAHGIRSTMVEAMLACADKAQLK